MNGKTIQKKPSLGKGITSLLGGFDPVSAQIETKSELSPNERVGAQANSKPMSSLKAETKHSVIEISLDAIAVNPHQPRRFFKDSELQSLAQSIKIDGVIQPVTVTRSPTPGKYILIAGERRLRASKIAGMDKIPVIIRDPMSEQEQLRVALIENIQRQDLNVVEEAEAYHALINDFGLTQEQCADKVGKERSTVANILRIVQLPREIQDDLVEGRLTMGHGRAILSLEDKKSMLRARDVIIKRALNVRQTEQFCKNQKSSLLEGESQPKGTDIANLDYLADGLRSHLKTKVKISGSETKGKIEIAYFSASELERLLSAMGHKIS